MGASRNQVNINYNKAYADANRLKEVSEQLVARANELKSQASALRAAWTGSNSARYIQKILEEADEIFRQAKNAAQIADAIRQTANAYKNAEMQRIANEEAAAAAAAAEQVKKAAEAAKSIATSLFKH